MLSHGCKQLLLANLFVVIATASSAWANAEDESIQIVSVVTEDSRKQIEIAYDFYKKEKLEY